jgi:teichuronic acid biosynthesis glycosyltransferase TuaG
MSEQALVTVVIPTYNHADFLREALQSLQAQSWSNWEAVVVNNYSTDDTEAMIESFGDPRIRLENFRNHGVIAASRNRAIEMARGEFVAFLDSDDLWLPQKLERCMATFRSGVDMVCHGLRCFGERSGNIYCGPAENATFEVLLLEGSCITPSATIIRTTVLRELGGFSEDPAVITAEDYHLWLKLAERGIGMAFLHEILGKYRIHGSNQSGSALRHMRSVQQVVAEFASHPMANGLRGGWRMRRRACLIAYGAARTLQRAGDHVAAKPMLISAIASYPFHLRSWLALAINCVAAMRSLMTGGAER